MGFPVDQGMMCIENFASMALIVTSSLSFNPCRSKSVYSIRAVGSAAAVSCSAAASSAGAASCSVVVGSAAVDYLV
jgi:hypothetical protein